MQVAAGEVVRVGGDVVLVSPTGTGKTLAFLLPVVEQLDPSLGEIQALVVAPTRELAQQIEQVARQLGAGIKITAVHGGRAGTLDRAELKTRPALLIGTPGRLADRFRRDAYTLAHVRTLVLDEFDKSLELGFAAEMRQIVDALPQLQRRVLTSATDEAEVPAFLGLSAPRVLDYSGVSGANLTIKTLVGNAKDKLEALGQALAHIGPRPGIVFVNFKGALQRVSDFLTARGVAHATFHGDLEQVERERALVKFRNGTVRLLLATDLAARGLDVPELAFVLHYHLPPRLREFTHRNGRTARMHRDGVAYVLAWEQEVLPDYLAEVYSEHLDVDGLPAANQEAPAPQATLYISAGRGAKVSKGDIVGFLVKQGGVAADQIGVIEVQQRGSYVGVAAEVAEQLAGTVDGKRLKKGKVRVRVL